MGVILENGYEMKTTFWSDFCIAERFGEKAIEDTFNRAFKEWKNNVVYLTELVMIMSWKSCSLYSRNLSYSMLYANLYHKGDAYAMDNLKDKDLEYYLKTTD